MERSGLPYSRYDDAPSADASPGHLPAIWYMLAGALAGRLTPTCWPSFSEMNLPDLPPASCGRLLFCLTPAYAVTASLIINLSGNFESVRLRVQLGRENL